MGSGVQEAPGQRNQWVVECGRFREQALRTRECAGALGPTQRDLARRTLAGMEPGGGRTRSPGPTASPACLGSLGSLGSGSGTGFRASGAWPTRRGEAGGGASAEQGRVRWRGVASAGRGYAEPGRRRRRQRPRQEIGAGPRRREIPSQPRSPPSDPRAGRWTQQSRVGGPGYGIREGPPPAVPHFLN